MTWRTKVVVRILLLVAQMLSEDSWLTSEIETIATHIEVGPDL